VPLSEGVDPLIIIMVYADAGSYSLGGFRPATMYNCSIVATNSIGNSVPSRIINVTTTDESELSIVQNQQIYSSLMKLN
jgi:hypothetical protein